MDIYEKLPVPFGLVRYGVAPDHPEVKVPHLRLIYMGGFLGKSDIARKLLVYITPIS